MRAIDVGDQRLEELWDAHARRLHAYARRHADAADAEDLVAEAYLVALRRIDDVPDESGEAFAWLVVTVRKLAAKPSPTCCDSGPTLGAGRSRPVAHRGRSVC